MPIPSIGVIFENGVFRPLQPVELPEGAVGQVLITPTHVKQPQHNKNGEANDEMTGSSGQRAYQLLMEIAALPHNPPDEQTDIGVRHDEILYPKNGTMP